MRDAREHPAGLESRTATLPLCLLHDFDTTTQPLLGILETSEAPCGYSLLKMTRFC